MLRIQVLFCFLICSLMIYGQIEILEPSYDLELLNAKFIQKDTSQILLLFKYQPKKGKIFKPIMSLKITYSLGDDTAKIAERMDKSIHQMEFYGRDMDIKAPRLFKLVSDKIDLKQTEEFGILLFRLKGITKTYVEKMKFSYGLWEPENEKIRFEKEYNISILK